MAPKAIGAVIGTRDVHDGGGLGVVGAIEAGGGAKRGSFRRTGRIVEPGVFSASASRAFSRRVATSGTILGDT